MPGRLLSAAVAVAITAFPLVPSEHVHEASDEHGRVHFYAHRHLAPDHANLPDKGATTLEDHDPLVTIDAAIAQPPQQYAPAVVIAGMCVLHQPDVIERCTRVPLTPAIHGPPLSLATLRAPPDSPRL